MTSMFGECIRQLTGVGDLCDLVALEAIPALIASRIHELRCGQDL
jgi:hypothetical protein